MVIAIYETLRRHDYNPQTQMWCSVVDIDAKAAHMCYVQFTLLNIPAEVIIGNSLTMEVFEVMRTPAHYLGCWDQKLKTEEKRQEPAKLVSYQRTELLEQIDMF